MSLYGALFASVSGLEVQSNQIGTISNNIANVNTVGYKEDTTSFQSLVTGSGQTSQFSPGGVLSQTQTLVDQQGQIQGTSSPTDLAISGNGFFVVKDGLTSTADTLYTRAGSFTQDSLGNFINSAGFYLQGWPLDRNGQLPGAAGNPDTNSANNLSSLQTVNVVSATGSAAETTTVSLSANLQASQTAYPGAGATAAMDVNGPNYGQAGASLILPDVLDGTALPGDVDSIERGDQFVVGLNATTPTAAETSPTATYTYGGFTYSRDVTDGSAGDSGAAVPLSPLTLGVTPFTTTDVGTAAVDGTTDGMTVEVTAANNGLKVGDVVSFADQIGTVNNVSGLDGSYVVSSIVDANHFTIRVADAANHTGSGGSTGVSMTTRPFAGNILDATTPDTQFLATTGTGSFSANALSFNITTAATGTVTFTYTSSSPNPEIQQFNTLDNLATAINAVTGLTARVSGGRLYVGATDANAAVTFSNVDSTGTSGPPVQSGIDWVGELGLSDIAAGTNEFNSLNSLASAVNATPGLSATVNNPLNAATITMNAADPLSTITFADPLQPAPLSNSVTMTTTPNASKGTTTLTIASPTLPSNAQTGDLVTLDATGLAGYPTPFTATGQIGVSTTAGADGYPVTITMNNTFTTGQVINIDPSQMAGYPTGTLNGIPLSDLSGDFTVQAVGGGGTSFTIDVPDAPTSNASGLGNGTLTVSPTINGVPLTALNGQFPITVNSGGTFSIDVPFYSTLETAGATTPAALTPLVITAPTNQGSLMAGLGLGTTLGGVAYNPATPESDGPLGPEYDPNDSSKNMAGGNITSQFSQNVQVFDSLGTEHQVKVSFIKTGVNTWAAEIYAVNPADVSSTFVDGLLASGTLTFNGDGSLRSVSAGLATPVSVSWTDGSTPSSVTFNWGTAGAVGTGQTNGMSQFDAAYAINFINQNGTSVGQLTGVTVTSAGIVVANFNNGQSQDLYQLPLALFSAPDQLESESGNVFTQTNGSGSPNLRQAGTSGAGTIDPSSLETSTVDLATELTSLIVAQQAYEANTKLVTTVDTMLSDLNQAIQG